MKKMFTTRKPETMATLHSFLTQQGIPVTVNERGEQLELWVTQTSYYAIAKQQIDAFKANPDVAAQAQVEQHVQRPSRQDNSLKPLLHKIRAQAGNFTVAVAILVTLVYLLLQTPLQEFIFASLRIGDYFAEMPGIQAWRFVTPVLLHFSLMHFVFNLFWWWYLGGRIELAIGWPVLVALFIGSAVVSNLAQLYSTGPYFGGLSGVVYALFGFCAVLSFNKPRHPLYLPPGLLVFMIGWLLLGYTDLLWVAVANEAHLAGLISGLVGAALYLLVPKAKRRC
ncbi:MAG: rhomboid family intramembrane serine protease [Idiomarina sp.]